MEYPDDAIGDVFRRLEGHNFDFSRPHVVDFQAVFATEAEADQIAKMYLADHHAGDKLINIETKPYPDGGMELILSKKMLLSYEAIFDFECKLAERVSQVEGYLDGWMDGWMDGEYFKSDNCLKEFLISRFAHRDGLKPAPSLISRSNAETPAT